MIVRTWRGRAANSGNADAYARHLEKSVFPKLGQIPGHRGAYLLRRDSDGGLEILVLTMWESMDAVRAFAGDHPETAVVEPAARAVLAEYDTTVNHYEVVLSSVPQR
ncbi:MAG: antibiotic biosynthesis monooxygenase family protein [Candidatus Micrarchaeota archaeon]